MGGVVGGIVGAALIAGIVAWFTIRRRRARSAPSTGYIDGKGNMGGIAVPYPLTIETPRLYVRVFFSPGHVGTCQSRTDRIFALSRTPQTRVRTPPRRHPRPSTRRTTALTSLALTPICKLTDRHIPAYPRSDRSASPVQSYLSRIKRTSSMLYNVGIRCCRVSQPWCIRFVFFRGTHRTLTIHLTHTVLVLSYECMIRTRFTFRQHDTSMHGRFLDT